MQVWVFGNPDVKEDALPVELLPELKKKFPQHEFTLQDPLDEWNMPKDHLCIIDTVKGAKRVTVFNGLDAFSLSPHITLHDYDALSELQLRKKVHGLPELTIIGVPMEITRPQAFEQIVRELAQL